MMKQISEFSDATIVAYLVLRGHKITPQKDQSGRIVFEVEGDIAKDVEAFYNNEPVGIMDYVRILKFIRGQIFNMKAMGRDKDKERR